MTEQRTDPHTATAILAGGCFWCLEAVFLAMKGVRSVQSGYLGGHEDAPSYERVCSGDTGHAEAVKIEFDPAVVSFDALLEVFFEIHDPTTPNRQGNDIGSQYRSAIFPQDAAQHACAEAYIRQLSEAGAFLAPIATTIEPGHVFHPAEAYHRDYAARNPQQPYIRAVSAPKAAKLRQFFPALLKPDG